MLVVLSLIVLGFLFYLLFVRGDIWKLLLLTVVPWCCAYGMKVYFPATAKIAITFTPYNAERVEISWAFIVSFILIFIGAGYFGSRGK